MENFTEILNADNSMLLAISTQALLESNEAGKKKYLFKSKQFLNLINNF